MLTLAICFIVINIILWVSTHKYSGFMPYEDGDPRLKKRKVCGIIRWSVLCITALCMLIYPITALNQSTENMNKVLVCENNDRLYISEENDTYYAVRTNLWDAFNLIEIKEVSNEDAQRAIFVKEHRFDGLFD